VWEGAEQPEGEPIAGLGARLAGRRVLSLGCGDADGALREKLKAVRRTKDEVEVGRIRRAVAATAAGFARLPELAVPGRTEREVQVELEAEFFRAGGERTAYGTIVGSGPNSAILHSTPSDRPIGKKDLVLVDAGCEIEGYCADVTRTLVRTAEQRALRDVVREAQAAAVARCRAGTQFRDVHLRCAADLARGLVDFGVLRGDPQGLVERDAVALFFPHGVGHLVGLGVRDGDSAPPRRESPRATLQYLRLDLPLAPGFVVTIEPGIYFIPALLTDRELREKHRDAVQWDRAEGMLGFGGIRIEDNVVVTDGDPENLTAAIPM
jgi:Xaa-Pro aminopeptidase